jgi:hypothetical protein
MDNFTLINLETMRTILENDIETSSFDIPDFTDVDHLQFYVQRAVLLQQIDKAIAMKEEYDDA